MTTYYFKVDEHDVIVCAINYPQDGFIAVELPDELLPPGIMGGWYKWNGETYVFDQQLFDSLYYLDEAQTPTAGEQPDA